MIRLGLAVGSAFWLLLAQACTVHSARPDLAQLQKDVADAERAFAGTMAARDHEAFTKFLSEEAVFYGSKSVLHGKQAVAEGWKRFFEGPDAPFAWGPDSVEVLDSGTLALSSGPVRDADGKVVAKFNSVWRLESGYWRVIFDKGCEVCDCSPTR